MSLTKLNKREITDELWRRGELQFLLHAGQKDLYDLYHAPSKLKKHVWLMARRFGKSHALVILALEQCLKHPKSIVKIASPTKDQIEKNMRPLFRDILENPIGPCPEELRPEWNTKSSIFFFQNGSEIQLAGTDKGNGERLRGGNAHIAMVDEAGSCDDLHNLINNILLPTTLRTKGKIILASTPLL
jgi:ribulose bisphosphate carboxylase small subunit